MADRADDFILTIDRESAGPVIRRRLSYAQHIDIPGTAWASMREAAAANLDTLDGWFSTYQSGAWEDWWLSFSSSRREAARQALLLGA